MGRVVIHARIITAENGTVVASASKPLPAGIFTPFIKEVLGEKTQLSASVFRSAIIPGWGQDFFWKKGARYY